MIQISLTPMKFESFVAISLLVHRLKFQQNWPTAIQAIGRAIGQLGPKTAKTKQKPSLHVFEVIKSERAFAMALKGGGSPVGFAKDCEEGGIKSEQASFWYGIERGRPILLFGVYDLRYGCTKLGQTFRDYLWHTGK